jgi:hypothetical protein
VFREITAVFRQTHKECIVCEKAKLLVLRPMARIIIFLRDQVWLFCFQWTDRQTAINLHSCHTCSLPLLLKYIHQFIIHKYIISGTTPINNNRTRTWILKAISKFRGCIPGIKQGFESLLFHNSIKKGFLLRRIMSFRLVNWLHRFGEACCLHFQNNPSFFDCRKQEAPKKYSYM